MIQQLSHPSNADLLWENAIKFLLVKFLFPNRILSKGTCVSKTLKDTVLVKQTVWDTAAAMHDFKHEQSDLNAFSLEHDPNSVIWQKKHPKTCLFKSELQHYSFSLWCTMKQKGFRLKYYVH